MRDFAAAADVPVPGTAAGATSEKAETAHKTADDEPQHHENKLEAEEAAVAPAPVADTTAKLAESSWRSLLRLDQQSDGNIVSTEKAAEGRPTASTLLEQDKAALPVSG